MDKVSGYRTSKANYTSDERLLSKIYHKLNKLDIKRIKKEFSKEETQRCKKHLKTCSTFLMTKKCKL